jgi:two-component system cell cycle sensor histidine kinase/response regulator CckA
VGTVAAFEGATDIFLPDVRKDSLMENLSPIQPWDEQDTVAHIASIVPDEAESEPEKSWAIDLARATESSEDTVVIMDAAGTIQFVNLTFEKSTGCSRYEVIGKNPYMLRSGGHDSTFYRIMCAALDRRRGWSGIYVSRLGDGTRTESEAVVSPICDVSGRVVSYVAVKRDVRSGHRSEERYGNERKMETVARLAGGIAHEFNNLLTVIIGYSDLLLSRLDADKSILHKIGEIKKAGERAALLTHQLLAFGRRLPLRPKPLSLNGLIGEMDNYIRCLAGESVELTLSLDEGAGLVEADPVQIEQAIVSLVANARDAMPRGGRLTIETADAELGNAAGRYPYVRPGSYVMLAIHDTGIGMDEEVQAHLFEPFFTTKEKATGLGLATVYGTVKQSGGYIWAYSKPHRGTTFKIYLPRVDTDAAEESRPAGNG